MTLQPTPIQTELRHFVTCPNPACYDSSPHGIDHLMNPCGPFSGLKAEPGSTYRFGPWTCTACQHTFSGELTRQADGSVTLATGFEPIAEKDQNHTGLVLLRSTNANGADPYYVIVQDDYTANVPERNAYKDFHYTENTCLTNWSYNIVALLRNTKTFVWNEDTDPHGLFEFVDLRSQQDIEHTLLEAGLEVPEDYSHLDYEVVRALFPQLFSADIEGQVAPARPGITYEG